MGDPCFALYIGPARNKKPRWVPEVITKRLGARSLSVRVFPRGNVRRRLIDQLRPRYTPPEDVPGDAPAISTSNDEVALPSTDPLSTTQPHQFQNMV